MAGRRVRHWVFLRRSPTPGASVDLSHDMLAKAAAVIRESSFANTTTGGRSRSGATVFDPASGVWWARRVWAWPRSSCHADVGMNSSST
jgi:hypothetical protein